MSILRPVLGKKIHLTKFGLLPGQRVNLLFSQEAGKKRGRGTFLFLSPLSTSINNELISWEQREPGPERPGLPEREPGPEQPEPQPWEPSLS